MGGLPVSSNKSPSAGFGGPTVKGLHCHRTGKGLALRQYAGICQSRAATLQATDDQSGTCPPFLMHLRASSTSTLLHRSRAYPNPCTSLPVADFSQLVRKVNMCCHKAKQTLTCPEPSRYDAVENDYGGGDDGQQQQTCTKQQYGKRSSSSLLVFARLVSSSSSSSISTSRKHECSPSSSSASSSSSS